MPKGFWTYARQIVAGILIALAILLIGLAAQESPSFQQCVAEHEAKGRGTNQKKLVARAPIVFRCAGVFLDNNAVLISAFATAVIAWFTINLVNATKTQAGLTRESIDLSREQIVALHRPKMRIRNIVVRPSNNFFSTPFAPNELVHGQFYMANVGGTVAHIKEALYEVFSTNLPLPMERPYEGKNGLSFQDLTIAAGSSSPLPFASDRPLSQDESHGILTNGSWQIYVMGWVEYEDDRRTRRRTAFCRKYDYARRRFYPVDDKDYEHEE
jgi:hypothetical protein